MDERELATTIISAVLASEGNTSNAAIEEAISEYRRCLGRVRAQWDAQHAPPPLPEDEQKRIDAKVKEANERDAKNMV